ncbi:lanthionine synthetase-like protein [Actinomadura pelletieri DSM 43383]|uniref:Lanthionine synthetase-like protein n=1 Tax=Actinomadura pelletieri DSM 43383 TaxID=1120940 RepID=A0A495Q9U4_9ACTN|nr:lanthionine synthetase C family protein [Actinomadura pelletieri]RKS68111.1 lanthionine synthetase-like protein [Actinomadura pelletieri DSM 43383]
MTAQVSRPLSSPPPAPRSPAEMHPSRWFALAVADLLADLAAAPFPGSIGEQVRRQSLAYGAPGIALLHIELAALGERSWDRAHDWLTYATGRAVASGPDSHLFYGAPAVAHALACAAQTKPGRYGRALEILDTAIRADVRARLDAAHARIDAGGLAALAEFDVIRGLTGFGSYLLRRHRDDELTRDVLTYLVRLTTPVDGPDGLPLPGWWTASGSSGKSDAAFPRGHSNNGLAHGIAGPLALLSVAALDGVTVEHHHTAITTILAWFDQWLTGTGSGPAWPYTINHAELAASRRERLGHARPSWCYGAAGVARSQQLAALAIGDPHRREAAETILAEALSDPLQRAATTDTSLCHGFAGLAHIAATAAADAAPSTGRLSTVVSGLLDAVYPADSDARAAADAALQQTTAGAHFLEGAVGTALAVLMPATGVPPRSGWDCCLLTPRPAARLGEGRVD